MSFKPKSAEEIRKQQALAELKRRAEEASAVKVKAEQEKPREFTVEGYCFKEQVAFINSPAKLKTAVCSRRAGKSEACAADLIWTALSIPRVTCLYVTLSRTSAERIIWRIIVNILNDYKIPHKINNKELIINLRNGSTIYVSGAKDTAEIEKFRGMSLKKVYIDEAQSFKSYIETLVDDILIPATWDVNGQIAIIGTPGPVPAGYFYKMSTNASNENFRWTIMDNPWILKKSGRTPKEILAEERARKGISESDPTYMREALGMWVKDENALVFRFDPKRNVYYEVPEKLNYIFGIDIGHNDADAIAVLGYNVNEDNVYLVEEYVAKKQNITSLIKQINRLESKYKPIKMVMDSGGLGKKIMEEIKMRHGIPVEAAQKERKLEFIELMNDDLRTGRFQAFPNSLFEQDSERVVWDYDSATRKVSDKVHSDIHDAALYAWRESKHFFKKDPLKQSPNKNTNAYMDAIEAKEAEAMEKEVNGEDEDWGVDDSDLEAVFDIYDNNGMDDY